jgi:hypothetical protein
MSRLGDPIGHGGAPFAMAQAHEYSIAGILTPMGRGIQGGRPATFTPEHICAILAIAGEPPPDSGRPMTH